MDKLPEKWQLAIQLWNVGRDTHYIAKSLGVHESIIYNLLPKHRQVLKDAPELERAVSG